MTVDSAETNDLHLFVAAQFAEAPEWMPYLPTPGVYSHPSYGSVDLSTEAVSRYVSNFNAGIYGQQNIPVDLEHDLPASGAMGYMRELRTNEDGSVDARVEWNDRGKQVIAENRFSYVSPTLREAWTDPVSLTTHKNVAVGAALTTRPYFKEASLRPLIVASEPAGTRQEETPMSEKTPEQEAVEINDRKFGEKIADLERKFAESEGRATAAETRANELTEEVKALKDAAQDREFREALKGCTDVDGRIAELKALPVELHEGYVKRAQAERDARVKNLNFSERGTDALGDVSALDRLNAAAREIQKVDPKLSLTAAFNEAASKNPDLYRQYKSEQRA
jgi:hypothetical protein